MWWPLARQNNLTSSMHLNNGKRSHRAWCILYDLPEDVLIVLLQYLDFVSLMNLAHTSWRLRPVVCCVLRHYLLPKIQVATVMDQEGRGVWTCRYQFYGLDHDEHEPRAVFAPIDSAHCHKRYRCDGSTAAPTLRQLVVFDKEESVSLMKKSCSLSTKACGGMHRIQVLERQVALSYILQSEDTNEQQCDYYPPSSNKKNSSSSSTTQQCRISPIELAIHVPLLSGNPTHQQHRFWNRCTSFLGV
ncbi:hypothetical protein O0I10_005129 [Lichtheimia ornata]|uniref:F-box domain-containing protein n=1 Tax=Lichtheimia ornata TaxID=688661 RepID=A0AAD7XZT9_9FUNG|nr:uncharacterized protein O0I10_005129 [Lichtheimia ornata]KAJ8659091.1 hypothetical protein O0I10_005129 [Lichtheimia ornata]